MQIIHSNDIMMDRLNGKRTEKALIAIWERSEGKGAWKAVDRKFMGQYCLVIAKKFAVCCSCSCHNCQWPRAVPWRPPRPSPALPHVCILKRRSSYHVSGASTLKIGPKLIIPWHREWNGRRSTRFRTLFDDDESSAKTLVYLMSGNIQR